MKLVDIFRLAYSSFKGNKLRTILTILGVGIGIGAITFLVSLGFGLQKLSIEKIATSEAMTTLDVTLGSSTILKLNQDAIGDFESIGGVDQVSPSQSLPAQGRLGSTTTDLVVVGIIPASSKLEEVEIVSGKSLAKAEESNSIVVSEAVAHLFNFENTEDALGGEVDFTLYVPSEKEGEKKKETLSGFRIVGVSAEKDLSIAYVPLDNFSAFGIENYDRIRVKVKEQSLIEEVREDIENRGYQVATIVDTIGQINKIFRIIQMILGGFGIIALIVAAIGMFNTMTISLLEKIREIGIMKSVGTTDFDVWKLFLAQSIIIGVLGGISGIVMGWLLGLFVNFGLNMLARSVGGETVIIFSTPFWFVVLIIIFSFLVGVFTGIYPAKRAAKLNPLDAIRYE